MQYADIALPVKTANRQETFTYRIPPALLADMQIGQRVYVPFYRRQLIGTVISLRATPPKIKGSFKEIDDLVEPFLAFTPNDLELARQVSRQYGATIGEILELAAPKPAKRTAKKIANAPPASARSTERSIHYDLYQPRIDRFAQYLTLVQRALAAKKSSLILFPSQQLAEEFGQYLTTHNVNANVLPSTQALTEYYTVWSQARLGENSVIIGTRKAIFVSPANLRLIIIDGPSEYGYKEEQAPYYHAATVAKLKANIVGSHLVFGDVAPRLEEWLAIQEGTVQLLPSSTSMTEITLVDTTTHRGLISDVLRQRVEEAVASHQKVALYFNRKGSGRFYRCLECETAIYCSRCDNLLTAYEQDQQAILRCSHCHYETTPPYRCPVCSSYRLGTVGLGIQSFAKIIAEHFPEAKIATLEQGDELDRQADIVISTAQLLYLPAADTFDLLAVFHVDQLLHGHQWSTNEQAYLTLWHLAERAKRLLIHTSEVEHPVIRAFCQNNHELLYAEEIKQRQQLGYPPIRPLLKLTYSNTVEEKAKQAADQLYEKYRQLLPQADQILLPPSPAGLGKQRGKYRYQIIIKSPLTRLILDSLPTDWQLDTEPTEL